MNFFAELKRRNVFRVGIAYLIGSWLLAQIAELLLDTFNAPEWTMQFIFVVLLIGFPIAIFFAWAFELTPDGVKRESEIDRSQSIVKTTGRKLDRSIIVILVLALGTLPGTSFQQGHRWSHRSHPLWSRKLRSISPLPCCHSSI